MNRNYLVRFPVSSFQYSEMGPSSSNYSHILDKIVDEYAFELFKNHCALCILLAACRSRDAIHLVFVIGPLGLEMFFIARPVPQALLHCNRVA